MDIEIAGYLDIMTDREDINVGPFKFYKGKLNTTEVVICKSGIGKVCAAACTTAMICRFNPDLIINTGIAGGLLTKEGMKTGDIVIASSVLHHDVSLTNFGYAEGQLPDMPLNFECDKTASETLLKSAQSLPVKVYNGIIASGDQFICSKEASESIRTRFNAISCEMESAPIGQVCYMHSTPFAIIRSISDGADDDATQTYEEFTEVAAKNAITLALSYLNTI